MSIHTNADKETTESPESEPSDAHLQDDNLLHICADCTTVTYNDVDACPACGSTVERFALGFSCDEEAL